MLAVSEGDLDAFEKIVRRNQEYAWRVAYRFLGQKQEAEDVVQDAFLRILEAADRYRPSASFRTYLYRVVCRLCLDRIKKKTPTIMESTLEIADPAPDALDRLTAREKKDAVKRALNALPPNQRSAIILSHYEGLHHREIAEILQITPKAVERRLARARERLLSELEELSKR